MPSARCRDCRIGQAIGVKPLLIEFWQDAAFRLHDRLEYRRAAPGEPWTTRTLYP